MRIQSLIAASAFAASLLYGTAAFACSWNDASAQSSDPTVVAAASGSGQQSMPATPSQTAPASTN